ncbi:uncharacterized protein LOC133884039 [Phragmites australis]|uniref:uncharacterized protein LOC133884039 n=1 Tax=Phragmites australis TaxID=29695 RepID=UPI002D778E1C|nr:uncharacterized protein LOC133884039 [Phragmites australis]
MSCTLLSRNALTNPFFLDTATRSSSVSLAAKPDSTAVYEWRTRRGRWPPVCTGADARSNKVTVAVTGKLRADALTKKLRRSGKHVEQWPEERKQPEHMRDQGGKDQTNEPGDNPTAPTEKPASGHHDANDGEPSSPKPSSHEPKKIGSETAKPGQERTESTDDNVNTGGAKEAAAEQSPKRKRKQQDEERPQPSHVSYSVARPSARAASSYSQPSPYSYYYGHGTAQWSAASPAQDSYCDLFSDDNANFCSVM